MDKQKAALRDEVRYLAEQAFYRKLISGYGDGPESHEYQIVYQGKPRHISLEQARLFLLDLLYRRRFDY
jgi:phosphopantetheinyl transferase